MSFMMTLKIINIFRISVDDTFCNNCDIQIIFIRSIVSGNINNDIVLDVSNNTCVANTCSVVTCV